MTTVTVHLVTAATTHPMTTTMMHPTTTTMMHLAAAVYPAVKGLARGYAMEVIMVTERIFSVLFNLSFIYSNDTYIYIYIALEPYRFFF